MGGACLGQRIALEQGGNARRSRVSGRDTVLGPQTLEVYALLPVGYKTGVNGRQGATRLAARVVEVGGVPHGPTRLRGQVDDAVDAFAHFGVDKLDLE